MSSIKTVSFLFGDWKKKTYLVWLKVKLKLKGFVNQTGREVTLNGQLHYHSIYIKYEMLY